MTEQQRWDSVGRDMGWPMIHFSGIIPGIEL